jgi:hypothetical protein
VGEAALCAESYHVILPTPSDFDLATRFLQHYRTGLRSGDALHLAIAQNHNADRFFTLDAKLIKAAKMVGIPAGSEIRDMEVVLAGSFCPTSSMFKIVLPSAAIPALYP